MTIIPPDTEKALITFQHTVFLTSLFKYIGKKSRAFSRCSTNTCWMNELIIASTEGQCCTELNNRTASIQWHPCHRRLRIFLTSNLQILYTNTWFVKSFWNGSTIGKFVNTFCIFSDTTKEVVVELSKEKTESPVPFYFVLFSFAPITFLFSSISTSVSWFTWIYSYDWGLSKVKP